MQSEVLHDSRISRVIELALMEDIGLGDMTSDAILAESQLARGTILAKQGGIVAGLEVAGLVFEYCDHSITLTPTVSDGGIVEEGQPIGSLDGSANGILKGERTALNFLQRMSGIATLTKKFVNAVTGTRAKITDTRKTAPNLRVLDKWAVRLGGGVNHRFGLDEMILIKDNHIVAAGSIDKAIELCKNYIKRYEKVASIEVETKNVEEVRQVLKYDEIARIMLDNFSLSTMKRVVDLIGGRVEVEASGGITLDNVRAIAETGVDFISIGALTHSVKALDISLELSHIAG